MNLEFSKTVLEALYMKYNHRQFLNTDPIQFLYNYDDPLEREIVGLVTASLSYGKVAMIVRNVKTVLETMGSPVTYLENASQKSLMADFTLFKHRFTTGEELARVLFGIKLAVENHYSLFKLFYSFYKKKTDYLAALSAFVKAIKSYGNIKEDIYFLPDPDKESACKRLFMFMRWMVREDDIDPGGWDIPASDLLVPLDTHMYALCYRMGLTQRKQANLKTAIEVTEAFRSINPSDPVKYDFSLTRVGILVGSKEKS